MIFFTVASKEPAKVKLRQDEIDERLFVRIGENDVAALEELYLLTERAVYALVLSILKDPDATQDVVQETYLKIRSAAHLYQPQGKPLAWIFTIAKNLSLSFLRQNKNAAVFDDTVLDDNLRYSCISDPTDRLVLTAALQILSEEERQVVLLHVLSGMTHLEIAKSFGSPLSTILSRYHRALKKLKNYLTERGGF
ncbi:MAG: RNA polymerase sigma factor [Pygmaiobacter sp.]